jgi:hypothetical protein
LDRAPRFHPSIHRCPADILALRQQRLDAPLAFLKPASKLGELIQPLANLRQERARFFTRVMLAESKGHISQTIPSPSRDDLFSRQAPKMNRQTT